MFLLTEHSFNFHIHFHFLVFMVAYFVALRQNLNHVKGSRAIVFISLSFLLILDFLLHFYISTAFYNHFHNQVKSEPCRAPGAIICPQHFTLCGGDTCIDRWVLVECGLYAYLGTCAITPSGKLVFDL